MRLRAAVHVPRGLSALALVAACSDRCPPVDPPYCVESELVLTQGIYGLVYAANDVKGSCPGPGYSPSFRVFMTAKDAQSRGVNTQGTDSEGVYQLQLPPGDYQLCDPHDRCIPVTVAAGGLVRADEEAIFGNGPEIVQPSTCAQ